ncbi:MAG: hypothetical protein LR011_08680 [Verrucomicrobia bacterium]|nr:hypothetical protein [Verrucomicrobiota bacterium]
MKKPLIIAGMAAVATICLPMTILSQEVDDVVSEVVTVTEEMVENQSAWTSYEDAQSEVMPDLPEEKLKSLREAVWNYFNSLGYSDTEMGSPIYADYNSDSVEWATTQTTVENVTYHQSSGEGIGFYPDSQGAYSQTTTWTSSASSTPGGGRAHWDESTNAVVYDASLTPEEKLAELNYLYRNSYISPGVYHGEKARLIPLLN